MYEEHHSELDILAVAIDAQGAEVARPWVEKAHARFTTVVDRENLLGELYGLKAVPIGIFVDEAGRLAHRPVYINVADDAMRAGVLEWAYNGEIPEDLFSETAVRDEDPLRLAESNLRFRLGQVLLDQGKKDEAVAEWRRAWELEPENWLIRKQVWAVEHPERFYEGNVDFDWQKEQIEANR